MPSDVRTGTVLAGFRIESQIGEGGMGTVYLAEDTRRGGEVALKVLVRDLAEDERFRRRVDERLRRALIDDEYDLFGDDRSPLVTELSPLPARQITELLRLTVG